MWSVYIMNVTGKMSNVSCWKNSVECHAIAEAGSFLLFTMEVQVWIQGSPYGICDCYCCRLFSCHCDFSLAFIIPLFVYTPISSRACTVESSGDATPRDLVLLNCCCNWKLVKHHSCTVQEGQIILANCGRLWWSLEVISPNSTQNFSSNWGTMKNGDPLLFITYVIEPPPIINCVSEPLLFAADTSIIISNRNFEEFCSV